ncbi:RidA family protein [Gluconobacter sp. P1C6_b]|uniref:RidA family protein n=1 Tax=Gluconobacter sp. P1C6_b TaxID=2762619 RepID=UPI001C042552
MRDDTPVCEGGIPLPPVSVPRGNYTPVLACDGFLFVAGQGPRWGDDLRYKGVVGKDFSVEEGQHAARLCALNIIAQVRNFLEGDLSRIRQLVRVAGVVRCTEEFEQQAKVLNGASDLFGELLGDAGRHVRIATGTSSLPSGMAVEVEAMFRID